MIRRDYLMRMIEQCLQALTRSQRLVQEGASEQARQELDQAIRELAGLDLAQISQLSEAELLGLLLQGEPTQILRQKCMLLVALLRQAAEIFSVQGKLAESRACVLKGLNLQLEMLLREDPFEMPEFVPRVEAMVNAYGNEPLPLRTNAALMQHYERVGLFAKAEDVLFNLLNDTTAPPGLKEFGLQFYERLLRQSDQALDAGSLPRAEVESGLAELRARDRV